MKQTLRLQALTFWLVFLAVFLVGIEAMPLFMPDESRYAEVPREMLLSGHWVIPQFNGLNYFEKPVLGYWVHAFSMALFGESEFALRLPSAIAVLLTALTIMWLMKRVGFAEMRYQAATVFSTLLLVACIGRLALLDSLFSLFICMTLAAYYVAMDQSETWPSRRWLLAAGASAGLAFLAKGFLGFVLPAMVLAPFLLWQREVGKSLRHIHWVILAALVVPLPWCIASYLRNPEFWDYFIWVEHVQRFFSAPKSQHPEPFWYYLPVLVAGSIPWLPFAGGVWRFARGPQDGRRFAHFLVCWLVVPLLFFSASSGKLATYLLPMMPAVAMLLCGSALLQKVRMIDLSNRFSTSVGVVLIVLGLWIAVARPLSVFQPSEAMKVVGLGAVIVVAGVLLAMRRLGLQSFYAAAWSMALFMLTLPFLLPNRLVTKKSLETLVETSHPAIDDDVTVMATGRFVGAASWYLKREDVLVIGDAGELSYGLEFQPDRHVNPDALAALVQTRRAHGVLIFASRKEWSNLSLPRSDVEVGNSYYAYRYWRPGTTHDAFQSTSSQASSRPSQGN